MKCIVVLRHNGNSDDKIHINRLLLEDRNGTICIADLYHTRRIYAKNETCIIAEEVSFHKDGNPVIQDLDRIKKLKQAKLDTVLSETGIKPENVRLYSVSFREMASDKRWISYGMHTDQN